MTYLLGLVLGRPRLGCWGCSIRCSQAQPCSSGRRQLCGGGLSWDSLCLASWASSPQDLCKAGARSCGKGWGDADRAGQGGCSPPVPAVPQAHWLSRQLGLLTSSCAGLHLSPPSCLISKANSLSDKSMSRGCPDWFCCRPLSHRGRGCRQDLDLRTPADIMLSREVQPRPQRKMVSAPADLCFWGAGGK